MQFGIGARSQSIGLRRVDPYTFNTCPIDQARYRKVALDRAGNPHARDTN